MRRILSLLVLLSMMLHCASRLGVLSYLYQERHSIAFTVGLIDEVPISVCGSSYDFGKGLKVEIKNTSEKLPAHFPQAREIQLFFQYYKIDVTPRYVSLATNTTIVFLKNYSSPAVSVFHPPSVS